MLASSGQSSCTIQWTAGKSNHQTAIYVQSKTAASFFAKIMTVDSYSLCLFLSPNKSHEWDTGTEPSKWFMDEFHLKMKTIILQDQYSFKLRWEESSLFWGLQNAVFLWRNSNALPSSSVSEMECLVAWLKTEILCYCCTSKIILFECRSIDLK